MVDIIYTGVLGCLSVTSMNEHEQDVESSEGEGPGMTKADLIDEVSKLSNLTKKETETIVNTIFDNITDALAKGDKVELRGFGSFRIRHRNSRKGSRCGWPS